MHGCWAYDHVQRPNFSTLVKAIGKSLAEDAEYFIVSSMSSNPPQDTSAGVSG